MLKLNTLILLAVILSTYSILFAGHKLYKVVWINDGDTILLERDIRVRYIGIDTPEVAHDGKKAEPFSGKARKFNQKLLKYKKIRLEFDEQRKDRYDRLLAYVFLKNGTFVNEKIIEHGLGYVLYKEPNRKYYRRLLKAQNSAIEKRVGIWSNLRKISSVRILANRKSRRFHSSSCKFGQKISKRNLVYYDDILETFKEGYSPAKECKGQFFKQ